MLENINILESSYPQTCRGHLISLPSAPKLESLLESFIESSISTRNHIPSYVCIYQSLIRPHLEYACSVWDPHLKKDIERLEGVQKFGMKVSL